MSYIGKKPVDFNDVTESQTFTVTGDLTVDTNTLYVDSTNNNVGLGTSSPNSYTGFTVLTLNNATNGAEIDFEKNGTVQGSIFTPASADDFTITAAHASGDLIFQAGGYTERMRIDSSGDIMAGTTSEVQGDSSGTGLYYDVSKGALQLKASGNVPIVANRVGSDGVIAQFRKDGTTVGSIEIDSGGFLIDGEANHTGLIFGGGAIAPRLNGSSADNTVNLGISSQRFENLFLGGGVYLGGTGSANALDDYEEGTFTPTLTPASGSYTMSSIQQGYYTKVGRLVAFTIRIATSGSSSPSGAVTVTGLPFTAAAITNGRSGCNIGEAWRQNTLINNIRAFVDSNSTIIYFGKQENNSGSFVQLNATDLDSGGTNRNVFVLTGHYFTA